MRNLTRHLTYLTLALGLSSVGYAEGEGKKEEAPKVVDASYEPFCKKIPEWPKGSDVPSDSEYKVNNVGTPITAQFAKSKWKQPDWLIIDTRGKQDRALGKIGKTVLLTADYKNEKKNEITEEKLTKKIKRLTKNDNFKTWDDIKNSNLNFIVFCNGKKCHRSSFAACELRRKGIPEDRVYLMLGGYPEWQSAVLAH